MFSRKFEKASWQEYKSRQIRITVLHPGSLLVLMNSCPESWFSAWQDHIIRFPWRRFPLVSCWCCLFSCGTVNTPVCWVDACHPQLILHSGALSLYLPLCPLWNVAAQGCWYTHPHPAKPTEQTNQNPVQYWGSEKSVGFPGILILCSRAEALPLLRGSESDKHTLSLVKKNKNRLPLIWPE